MHALLVHTLLETSHLVHLATLHLLTTAHFQQCPLLSHANLDLQFQLIVNHAPHARQEIDVTPKPPLQQHAQLAHTPSATPQPAQIAKLTQVMYALVQHNNFAQLMNTLIQTLAHHVPLENNASIVNLLLIVHLDKLDYLHTLLANNAVTILAALTKQLKQHAQQLDRFNQATNSHVLIVPLVEHALIL